MNKISAEYIPLILSKQNPKNQEYVIEISQPHSRPSESKETEKIMGIPSVYYGYLCMALSACFGSIMIFLVHLSSTSFSYPSSSMLVVRSITGITLSISYIRYNRLCSQCNLSPKQTVTIACRDLLGAIGEYLVYYALARISVGTTDTLFFSNPTITSVFAVVFLSDSFSTVDLLTIATNFAGIVLVSRPSAFSNDQESLRGVTAALAGSVVTAGAYTLVKMISTSVHYMFLVLSFSIGCCVISFFVCDPNTFIQLRYNYTGTVLSVVSGIMGFAAQAFLNRGLQLCRPGPAVVVQSLNVPLSFSLGLIFLNERIDCISAIGVILVLASVAGTGFSQILTQ